MTRKRKERLRKTLHLLQSGKCALCREPVSLDIINPKDPLAPTLDHIVPLSRGGALNATENVRLAHRSCNMKRGNRMDADLDSPPIVPNRRDHRVLMRARYAHLYAPAALARLSGWEPVPDAVERHQSTLDARKNKPARGTLAWALEHSKEPLSLPRGATLPKEDEPVAVYQHSVHRRPRKLTGVELARAIAKIVDKPKRKRRQPQSIRGIDYDRLYRPIPVSSQ